MEFLQSQRGGRILVLNNYQFRIKKTTQTRRGVTTQWKCKSCNASARLLNNELDTHEPQHDHEPERAQIEVKRRLVEFKRRSIQQPLSSMKRLYSEIVHQDGDGEVVSKIPRYADCKSTMYRARAA